MTIYGKKMVIPIGTLVLLGAIFLFGEEKLMSADKASIQSSQEIRQIRKLALTLGQSAHSVKMHPALIDKIDEDAFVNLISAHMNQPFDFTYYQEGITFNVPLTHTLSLWSREKKLSNILIELAPLYEDDFVTAVQVLEKWQIFFDGTGLKKYMEKGSIKIESCSDRLKLFPPDRGSCSTETWVGGDAEFSLGLTRFERTTFNISTKEEFKKPVYKISIFINSISLREAER
jgi:hypothetical protein